MAARFWVGTGTWDATNTANWSATSGGATGVSVPTAADDVTFDANSTFCNIDYTWGGATCKTLTFTGGTQLESNNEPIAIVPITVAGNITITPTAAAIIRSVNFISQVASAATAINVNISGISLVNQCYISIGYGIASTATYTITTNGNFWNAGSNAGIQVDVHSGTLSSGAINATHSNLVVYGGTYTTGTATTITVNGYFLADPGVVPSPATVTLNTATINATDYIQLGSGSGASTTTINVGATQTLSAPSIYIYPTNTTTLRTVTATNLINFTVLSGATLTAGAVTCNGTFTANAFAGYATLPAVVLTSLTGTSTTQCSAQINEVAFTCGAISLTYSGTNVGDFLYYREYSKGQVTVTGAITLVDTNVAASPGIVVASQAAFSGTPTVGYNALNASVRGTVSFENQRNATATTITAGTLSSNLAAANATTGAVTLGGTLSSIVYNGTLTCQSGNAVTTQISSLAQGTGAAVELVTGGANNFNATSTVACTRISSTSTGTFTIAGATTVTNNGGVYAGTNIFNNCSSVSFAALTISGTGLDFEYTLLLGQNSNPVGNITFSGALTTGSAATNRGTVQVFSTGTVSFPNATHSMRSFYVGTTGTGGVTFVAGATLALNYNSASPAVDYPLLVGSNNATVLTFRTVTSDYSILTSAASAFYIDAPNAAISFTAVTTGATGAPLGFVVANAVSLTCPAISVDFYFVTAQTITQSGAITVSNPTPRTGDITIQPSGTSTVAGINLSAVTTAPSFEPTINIFLGGSGQLTISSTIVGPTSTSIDTIIAIDRLDPTIFSGNISAITQFLHTQGNITFTGALTVGLQYQLKMTSGFTFTPNTSVITIAGTNTLYPTTAIFDHGGYTYNSVILNTQSNFVKNTTSASGVSLTSFTCTGAANPRSFLSLGTNVTVTGSSLTLTPNSITNRLFVCSDIIGTARTLTASTRTGNTGLDFRDITASPAGWNLSAVSTGDVGGNTGITFTTAVTRYIVPTGTVTWDSTAAWSATPGGAGPALTAPLAQDTVDLSTGTTVVISTNNRRFLGGSINFGGFTGTLDISSAAEVYATDNITFSGFTNAASLTSSGGGQLILAPYSALPAFVIPTVSINAPFAIMAKTSVAFSSPATLIGASSIAIAGDSIDTNSVNVQATSGVSIGSVSLVETCSTYPGGTTSNVALDASNISASSLSFDGVVTANGNPNVFTAGGGISFNSATVTLTNATFDAGGSDINVTSSVLTLGSSILTCRAFNFNSGTWNAQTEVINAVIQIYMGPSAIFNEGSAQFYLRNVFLTAVYVFLDGTNQILNSLTLDDVNQAGTWTTTSTVSLYGRFSGTNGIRKFNTTALRRIFTINTQYGSTYRFGGGFGTQFSTKASSVFTGITFQVINSETLYITHAFLTNCTASIGNVVAYGPANISGNTGNITFPSRLRYYAFVNTTTSFTIPPDYNGMGVFLGVGGGATPSSVVASTNKGGGGGGGRGYLYAIPLNNPFAPITIGQTIYVKAASYAVAPAFNTAGGNGDSSWVNVVSNATPTSVAQGLLVLGGSTTTSTTAGSGGSVTYSNISFNGGSGGAGTSGGGGGGGSSLFAGGAASSGGGGGGGGGISSTGFANTSTQGGNGGSGSVAGGLGGSQGTTPTAGAAGASATGAGGGGGGRNTSSTVAGVTILSTSRPAGSTTLTVTTTTPHGYSTGQPIIQGTQTYLKTGTYSRAGSITTVTITNHGLSAGEQFYLDATSGVVPDGTYTVLSVTNANVFTISLGGSSTSGNCRLGQSALTPSPVAVITVTGASTFEITTINNTILSPGQITFAYTTTVLNTGNGANGGDGALSSAQNFIRYYNNVYSPGFFGVGAGGGGGGGSSNALGDGGNGGNGGIGAGGGGVGGKGTSLPTANTFSLSGRGGPGLIMFIYALRANNQSAIQGM